MAGAVLALNRRETMAYKAPKTIAEHPAVFECDSGKANGSDYKHDVLLREGWVFAFGRMAGCRSGLFHTAADFIQAQPTKKA